MCLESESDVRGLQDFSFVLYIDYMYPSNVLEVDKSFNSSNGVGINLFSYVRTRMRDFFSYEINL